MNNIQKFAEEFERELSKKFAEIIVLKDELLEKYSHSPTEHIQNLMEKNSEETGGHPARLTERTVRESVAITDKNVPEDICKKCNLQKSEHDEGDIVKFQCPDIDEACEGDFTNISLTDKEKREITNKVIDRKVNPEEMIKYTWKDVEYAIKLTEQKIKEKLK